MHIHVQNANTMGLRVKRMSGHTAVAPKGWLDCKNSIAPDEEAYSAKITLAGQTAAMLFS